MEKSSHIRRRAKTSGRRSRAGFTYNSWIVLIASVVAILILIVILRWNAQRQESRATSLVVYCAAGIKPPLVATMKRYAEEYDVAVKADYAGSGTLLSRIRASRKGDLYIPADQTYIELARQQGLLDESIPLASLRPVIGVPQGNPRGIRSIEDLLSPDIQFALANPDAASIGRVTREVLKRHDLWEKVRQAAKVFKPTVMDLANDLKVGAVDAAILWNATANQYPEIDIVPSETLQEAGQYITVGVLRSCNNPAAALRFARYLAAPEKGLAEFERLNYESVEGDPWVEQPRVILYSGGVNRLAIEETVKEFERREGVHLERVYNGCGILVSQMKGGERPDAYFACDSSFVPPVAGIFHEAVNVSQTQMVIIVQKGNPREIHSLQDLTKSGLKIGVANPDQSALGELTRRLLLRLGLLEGVMKNVRVQTPTADMLVIQMRAGPASLDAAIVYRANTTHVGEFLEVLPIEDPGAVAIQPFVIGKESRYPQLMARLLEALSSPVSRERFEKTGFSWRGAHEGNPLEERNRE